MERTNVEDGITTTTLHSLVESIIVGFIWYEYFERLVNFESIDLTIHIWRISYFDHSADEIPTRWNQFHRAALRKVWAWSMERKKQSATFAMAPYCRRILSKLKALFIYLYTALKCDFFLLYFNYNSITCHIIFKFTPFLGTGIYRNQFSTFWYRISKIEVGRYFL